ncbi:hypothetical protein DPMN_044767 [Dreissena polymorpha]|uniref:Uncharacterized protein n=1 Tax=Dreissena polymorpha TaxID=45954 RepID=A0A9D4D539_DREPO|nr:hypothetical protein DPMN_044767 [Dreissena polymorpha]
MFNTPTPWSADYCMQIKNESNQGRLVHALNMLLPTSRYSAPEISNLHGHYIIRVPLTMSSWLTGAYVVKLIRTQNQFRIGHCNFSNPVKHPSTATFCQPIKCP